VAVGYQIFNRGFYAKLNKQHGGMQTRCLNQLRVSFSLANRYSGFYMANEQELKASGSLFGSAYKPDKPGLLAQRFIVPPFSTLDARAGYWQDRKRAWLALGIQSELGRGAATYNDHQWQADKLGKVQAANTEGVKRLLKASPGGSPRPAMDYRNNERGSGNGKPIGMALKGKPFRAGVDELIKLRTKQKELAKTYGSGGPGSLSKQFKQGKAVPGGGTGKNSAYMFRTQNGNYEAFGDLIEQGTDAQATGTSIFDPVLCECILRWFSPHGGNVLDPFAGGSVRGIVSARLGRHYCGIDLREEQIEANVAQGLQITPTNVPTWITGDSLDVTVDLRKQGYQADFCLSCPPYADLEVYSDNPKDISTMEYPQFLEVYRKIIKRSCKLLKDNRFAAFVVGEVRGKDGNYIGFVPDTIQAFKDAGLGYYNSAVLLTAVGSLPIRIGRQFLVSRKLGTTHQSVLVFCKGDPKKAASACARRRLNDDGGSIVLPAPKKRTMKQRERG
jgi:hypothetical protein